MNETIPEVFRQSLEKWDAGWFQPKDIPSQRNTSVDNKHRIDGILNQAHFLEACKRAQTTPTRRQASKFARKRGLAYRNA